MFIAGVYYALAERSPAKLLDVQAFVGVLAVPLTYLLARRLNGIIAALVAAGIVAFDGSLVDHAPYMYAEILYTPLLLAALLALLWALQAPRLGASQGLEQAWPWSPSAVPLAHCSHCFCPCCCHGAGA
jgi:dolichyl-phosphate-mannose--protein O-mannosyl transferase